MEKSEQFTHSREAAKITFDKVSSWEELNAATLEEGDKKFSEKTKELWKDFAVSGTLQFDPKEGKQVLRPLTDLDGKSAVGILGLAGIDTSNLKYIRPGEFLGGAINLDTGDKFGVVYEEPTYTAFFDHHALGTKEVTSTTEIVYKTMIDLGMVEKSEALGRLVKFVTDIDNRRLPPTEFLKSGKTIIGVQRDLDFKKMLEYFKDHESPTEELKPEEFEKYGLRESAERQQRTVDESMQKLEEMYWSGKVANTKYGQVVINENNELKTGSSAAYVKYDGIINFTPGKSFAVTLKEKDLDEAELRRKLGDKFQGKIIRGKMWIYNEKEPLNLSLQEILNALGEEEVEQKYNDHGGRYAPISFDLVEGWRGNLSRLAGNRRDLVRFMKKVPSMTELDYKDAIKYFGEYPNELGLYGRKLYDNVVKSILENDAEKAAEYYKEYGSERMFDYNLKFGLQYVLAETDEEREKFRRALLYKYFWHKCQKELEGVYEDSQKRVQISYTEIRFNERVMTFLRLGGGKEEFIISEDGKKMTRQEIDAWGEIAHTQTSDSLLHSSVIIACHPELNQPSYYPWEEIIRKWIKRYSKN